MAPRGSLQRTTKKKRQILAKQARVCKAKCVVTRNIPRPQSEEREKPECRRCATLILWSKGTERSISLPRSGARCSPHTPQRQSAHAQRKGWARRGARRDAYRCGNMGCGLRQAPATPAITGTRRRESVSYAGVHGRGRGSSRPRAAATPQPSRQSNYDFSLSGSTDAVRPSPAVDEGSSQGGQEERGERAQWTRTVAVPPLSRRLCCALELLWTMAPMPHQA